MARGASVSASVATPAALRLRRLRPGSCAPRSERRKWRKDPKRAIEQGKRWQRTEPFALIETGVHERHPGEVGGDGNSGFFVLRTLTPERGVDTHAGGGRFPGRPCDAPSNPTHACPLGFRPPLWERLSGEKVVKFDRPGALANGAQHPQGTAGAPPYRRARDKPVTGGGPPRGGSRLGASNGSCAHRSQVRKAPDAGAACNYPPPMASAELSRRVEKVVGYPPPQRAGGSSVSRRATRGRELRGCVGEAPRPSRSRGCTCRGW